MECFRKAPFLGATENIESEKKHAYVAARLERML